MRIYIYICVYIYIHKYITNFCIVPRLCTVVKTFEHYEIVNASASTFDFNYFMIVTFLYKRFSSAFCFYFRSDKSCINNSIII